MADLDDLRAHLAVQPSISIVYSDLDGTLLGRGGALLRAADGTPTRAAANALVRLDEAAVDLVVVSGRRRAQLEVDARILGAAGFVAEAGTVIVRNGQVHYAWGEAPRDLGPTPHAALLAAGALEALLEAFPEDLRPYEPWATGREGTHLLHGRVDVDEADTVLRARGCGWAQLVDNGATGGRPGRDVHAYHLRARGVGKAAAVTTDLAHRGIEPAAALAVGDSAEDATMAAVVGTYAQVGGGHGPEGTFTADSPAGEGFAEVIDVALAARGDRS